MKFSTMLVLAAASLSTVLAAPAVDGGKGVPPPATISASPADAAVSTTTVVDTTTTVTSTSASSSATNVHTTTTMTTTTNVHGGTTSASSSASAASSSASTAAHPDIQIPFGPSNALFQLAPATAADWKWQAPNGVFNVTAPFSVAQQETAQATFLPPQTFAGLQIWAWQQPDGGMMQLEIDGHVIANLDYWNKTAGAHDLPVKLYDNPHLVRAHHTIVLKNIVDTRVHKAGTFNLDHVVITTEEDASTTTSASSTAASTQDTTSSVSSSAAAGNGESGTTTSSSSSASTTPPPGAASALGVSKAVVGAVALVAGAFALL